MFLFLFSSGVGKYFYWVYELVCGAKMTWWWWCYQKQTNILTRSSYHHKIKDYGDQFNSRRLRGLSALAKLSITALKHDHIT